MTNRGLAGQRVVVTGGAGFIGSHLVELLLSRNCFVHVLDDLSGGCRENLPLDHDRLRLDVMDVAAVGENAGRLAQAVAEADFVFHLASPIGVREAHEHRYAMCSSILAGGLAISAACRAHGTPLLVTSSSEVYGTGRQHPLAESDLAPLGLEARWGYAVGKLAVEHLALGLHEETGIPVWVVRFFNVAGGRQRPETGLCVAAFAQAALDSRPIVVHGNGQQQRAFLHVKDAVEGLIAVASCSALIGMPVNIGGTRPVTIAEVATETVRVVNSAASVQFQPAREIFGPSFCEATIRIPNLSRMMQATGWLPTRDLAEMIGDCAQSCRRTL